MKIKREFTGILFLTLLIPMFSWGQDSLEVLSEGVTDVVPPPPSIDALVGDFLRSYSLPGNPRVRKATLQSYDLNETKETLLLTLGGGAEEMYYTEEIVSQIYSDLYRLLGARYPDYTLTLFADNHQIEELIPTASSKGKVDKHKVWRKEYDGVPWVSNKSCPYSISKGLSGRHISLCQSHGKYYKSDKGAWLWQRPRLFCTTEDLLSQTFVIPYIIPMLENAGAIVFTPRDRFWQSSEVIVDNDDPDAEDISYFELSLDDDWEKSDFPGFGLTGDIYYGNSSPFGHGTCRQIRSTKLSKRHSDFSLIQWLPEVPRTGRYPVYVSYQSFKNSSEDVTYEIYHLGGMTSVSVNQKMGGGTWVYLGEYEFPAGHSEQCKIVLSNVSRKKGNIVSADALRLGGGMGNIERGGSVSGLPRWAEGAKYSVQWYGFPDSCFNNIPGDEYRSDIYSRPVSSNTLGGGSVYSPSHEGKNVPIELCMAFHTDAGYSKVDDLIGPLSICTTSWNDGLLDAGLDRYTSRDLASLFLEGINRDMKKYGYTHRGLWNKNYGESRASDVPSLIFEMLSHQNFADMRLAYDPHFKFDLCRSIYKSVLRYICSMHDVPYVVEPLPVKNFSVELDRSGSNAILSWTPTYDDLEPSASPTRYVVYTRKGGHGFDNGIVVNGTSAEIPIESDQIYSFKVCALNEGGVSFPSETLSAMHSSRDDGTVLIVNGFTRLEGPAWFNNSSEQGFLLDEDPGVQYGAFAGFCGAQKVFTKSTMGSEAIDGLGYSGSELEGKVVMGNTFDYPYIHGVGIASSQCHSFISMSEGAFLQKSDLSRYHAIDMIYGVQKEFSSAVISQLRNYKDSGGRLILSGGNLQKSDAFTSLLPPIDSAVSVGSRGELTSNEMRFSIYRDLNEESYCVPSPEVLPEIDGVEVLSRYSDGSASGLKIGNVTVFGFPLESVTDQSAINALILKGL